MCRISNICLLFTNDTNCDEFLSEYRHTHTPTGKMSNDQHGLYSTICACLYYQSTNTI